MFDLSGPNVAFQPADQPQGASMNAHERDTKPDSLKKEMRLNLFQPLMSENAENEMLSRCIRSTSVQKK